MCHAMYKTAIKKKEGLNKYLLIEMMFPFFVVIDKFGTGLIYVHIIEYMSLAGGVDGFSMDHFDSRLATPAKNIKLLVSHGNRQQTRH